MGFHKHFSLKHLVLNEFLELSESSIHFSNASGRFLSISDEFSGDYQVFEADYPAGLFFFHGSWNTPHHIKTSSWNHHLMTLSKILS